MILFAPDSAMTYDNFGAAIGVPMTLLLPVMAILSVTSEWSQRSGLTTFTLVPHRGRVIWAKMVVSMALGAVSIGRRARHRRARQHRRLRHRRGRHGVGHLRQPDRAAGPRQRAEPADRLHARRADPQLPRRDRRRSSSTRSCSRPSRCVLGNFQQWWEDLRPWLDFNWAQGELYDGHLTSTEWAQLGTSGLIWLVVPLAVGLVMVMRSEVK